MQLRTSRRSQHQNKHTHARAHTHLCSVFDQPMQPTCTLATASSPDRLLQNTGRLHSLLEHSQSPTDEGCRRGKGSTLKIRTPAHSVGGCESWYLFLNHFSNSFLSWKHSLWWLVQVFYFLNWAFAIGEINFKLIENSPEGWIVLGNSMTSCVKVTK